MKITWLGGWAIPTKRVLAAANKQYPNAEHDIIYPGEFWKDHLPQSADLYMGYSLGAFLLLANLNILPRNAQLALLAPFLDLKSESGLGGLVSLTQLKMLKRWMAKDAEQALDDFYARAGLRVRCQGELPYHKTDLDWGLDQLINGQAPKNSLANIKQVIVGANDPLVDAASIAGLCKHAKIVNDAGHRLADLLPFVQLA